MSRSFGEGFGIRPIPDKGKGKGFDIPYVEAYEYVQSGFQVSKGDFIRMSEESSGSTKSGVKPAVTSHKIFTSPTFNSNNTMNNRDLKAVAMLNDTTAIVLYFNNTGPYELRAFAQRMIHGSGSVGMSHGSELLIEGSTYNPVIGLFAVSDNKLVAIYHNDANLKTVRARILTVSPTLDSITAGAAFDFSFSPSSFNNYHRTVKINDGKIFISGHTASPAGNMGVMLNVNVNTDTLSFGTEVQWFSGANYPRIMQLIPVDDGRIIAVGAYYNSGTSDNKTWVALLTVNGNTVSQAVGMDLQSLTYTAEVRGAAITCYGDIRLVLFVHHNGSAWANVYEVLSNNIVYKTNVAMVSQLTSYTPYDAIAANPSKIPTVMSTWNGADGPYTFDVAKDYKLIPCLDFKVAGMSYPYLHGGYLAVNKNLYGVVIHNQTNQAITGYALRLAKLVGGVAMESGTGLVKCKIFI